MTRITVYQHAIGDWRGRFIGNGQTIMSPEGMYKTEHEARMAVFRINAIAPVVLDYSAEGQRLFADAVRRALPQRENPANGSLDGSTQAQQQVG